ncbi:MAG: 3-oxoacyl-ACP reductase family protein [Chloroflexota bacterium]|nr:3-oxoacyl-ACP reductase family protein [Chloroflexota bacterium]
MLLENRVAIVTGGARGLGQSYCLGLHREGAKVVVADIIDTTETVTKIKQAGGEALGIKLDVRSAESTQQMAAKTVEAFGKIDILINNAALYGDLKMQAFHEISEEEWDRLMSINVKGVWQCTKAVAPHMMQQQYGKIINISSGTILMGVPGLLHYVTSKGAVWAMSRVLSRELGGFGIRVNCITPGFTMSQASRDIMKVSGAEGMEKQIAAQAALGREEEPEDLVGAVLFLSSELSDFITGQTINVDGGVVHW